MGKLRGSEGVQGTRLLGQLVATEHKSNFFKRPENALGGKWKVERARLFTAMPRGAFPKPGQLRGTGITVRENESRLGSLRLIQALTWLPEPALPQPSRAGEGRTASVGKVRLLKCKKTEEGGKEQWRSWIISIITKAGERFIRAEEWVHRITWLEKKEEWSSHSIICPEMGSSGNTRGCCCLRGENSFFRRSVKTTISLAVVPRFSRGLPSFRVRVASQQAGGKPATF